MCGNARKRIKNKIKEKGENIGARVAACRYLLSQARQHAKKLERVLYMNCLVSARKKGHNNQRK